jgi:hypothetical protein
MLRVSLKGLSRRALFGTLCGVVWAQRPDRPQRPTAEEREGKLRPGDVAPDFLLKMRGSEERVRLSGFHGKKPVAIVFGSFT